MDPRYLADLTPEELQKLVEKIGHTPLLPLSLKVAGKAHKVYLKLEGANPSGSVKDRTAYSLIRDLERKNLISKQTIIVESSSGNLGVALSLICKAKQYRLRVLVDPKTTRENIALMEALDAEIEMVDKPDSTGGYLLSRLARIQELCRYSSNYVWTNQYTNAANPQIHFLQTGKEIYQQMNSQPCTIFVAVSTGGTLVGVARYFRLHNPQTRIVAVDVHGSVIFGTAPGPRKLTGIGASRSSDFITPADYDDYSLVSDEEAFAFCRALYAATGIKVGGSSGAVLSACARYLETHSSSSNVVCVCADTGEKYTSSIFNDTWLDQQHLYLTQKHLNAVQDISEAHSRLVSGQPIS